MRKIFPILALTLLASSATFAQTSNELKQQQIASNKISMQLLNAKPTKDAKRQAKELKKQGWTVPAGELSIEKQITRSQIYSTEMMTDEEGNEVKQYIMHTAMGVMGSYNAAYTQARANAQTELAAMIETQLVAAIETKTDGEQTASITAVSIEKFHQHVKSIVDQALSNSIPVMTIYRRLPNNSIEVQVGLAFNKKELSARLKRNVQKELENEGNVLDKLVDDVVNKKL